MKESGDIDDPHGQMERENLPTVTAFLFFGCLCYTMYALVIAGAQDILAGTFTQTSFVYLASVGPNFIVCLIAPYFMQMIPYSVRITAVGIAFLSSSLVLAFANQIHWKFVGIVLASLAIGVGETTVLALTSFYHEVSATAFSAGTGLGLTIAPLYYTAMTTWACVSPKIAFAVMAPTSVLIFVCYFVMEKKHLRSASPPEGEHTGVEYTALHTKEDGCDKTDNAESGTPSFLEKFHCLGRMLPNLIPIFIAWFSEYLIIQGVVTTLAFSNAPLRPRDHYQYYFFTLVVAEVVGRSYLVVLSLFKAECAEKAKFPHLCVLAMIEVSLLLFFTLAAWYRFLPNVWIVFLLLFVCGVVIGVLYVNAVAFFRDSFEDRYREFVMASFLVAISAGAFAASLIGLHTETLLLEHCTTVLNDTRLCFTRSRFLDRFTSSCSSRTR